MTTRTAKDRYAAWRAANIEKVRAYDRARYVKRPDVVKARARAWHEAHPERVKAIKRKSAERNRDAHNARARARHGTLDTDYRRRRALGVTRAAFAAMLSRQGDCCAVCATADPGRKNWQLDHDHQTGGVRGVLCSRCNLALGLFKDDPARMRAAAVYVERHTQLQELL